MGDRSKEFDAIFAECTENLKWLHQTSSDVLSLTVSGTGAMEAGIINFLSAGDKVLVGTNGKYGERWAEVAEAYGLNAEIIKAEWRPTFRSRKLPRKTRSRYREANQSCHHHALGNLHRRPQRPRNYQPPR